MNLVGYDQMGLYALGLGPQVLFGGKDYLRSGVFLAKEVSEYFAEHQRLYGHQYSYYYCRRHERGLPSVHEQGPCLWRHTE
jgi:hypothetical protein